MHSTIQEGERGREREGMVTDSGLPTILATTEVASERIEEVSTPSRLTFVERFRHGIVSRPSLSLTASLLHCRSMQLQRTLQVFNHYPWPSFPNSFLLKWELGLTTENVPFTSWASSA